MNQVKWLRISLMLLLALGLAIPAVAQVINDSEEPGSVIVFPKFVKGVVNGEPRSEFEVSLVCPPLLRLPDGSCDNIGEGTRFKLKAEWVCPGSQKPQDKFICKETDFELFTTLNGTVSFNPNNIGAGGFPILGQGSTAPTVFTPTVTAQRVTTPPCDRGYVIVWVVDIAGHPIKFDGLIGDAVLREENGATSAYNGVPIQASGVGVVGLLPQGTILPLPVVVPGLVASLVGSNTLPFDGIIYKQVNGSIASSLRFEQGDPNPVRTDLTLLTLDVFSNAPNAPTFVDLDFYNANEYLLSTSTEFICWEEVRLTDIDPNLTVDGMQTRKGLVVSPFFARKIPIFGIADPTINPVTGFSSLMGIATTVVGNQSYSYSLFNHTIGIPTAFIQ